MQCVTWYKIQSQVIWLKILKAINYAGLINKSSKVFPGAYPSGKCTVSYQSSMYIVHKSIALEIITLIITQNGVPFPNGNRIENTRKLTLYGLFWLSKYCFSSNFINWILHIDASAMHILADFIKLIVRFLFYFLKNFT